ncbi:MAG: carbohydrate kinase family protein [Hyphomicrobiaceae bacterium]
MKVLTVGGAMVDTIAIIESDRIERMTMRNADTDFLLLEEGRKIETSDISGHVGGGAVNAAVSLARAGHDVSTLLKLGTDARAETVLARLADEGVSTRWVIRDDRAPTGASVLIASHERNAAIFTFRGANTLLEPADLNEAAFGVDLVYISSLSNDSADRFPELIKRANDNGATVATNPGTRQLSARGGAFFEALDNIDILCINASEADVLVPSLVPRCGEGGPMFPCEDGVPPRLMTRGFSGGGFDMSLPRLICELRSAGVDNVVITDGMHGAFLATADELLWCPVLKTKVVGTAGAGDAFASTLAGQLATKVEPGLALQAAACNAASVVGAIDTQTGLLKKAALSKAVKRNAAALPVMRWAL